VASVLDVDPSRIRMLQGDTDEVPAGTGTFASRSMQVGGSALHLAALDLLAAARLIAAELLEVDAEDLEYSSGAFMAVGAPQRAVSLEELALQGPRLTASRVFASPQAFPYGTHLAVVEIDRETGRIDLRTVIGVDDCGTMVNPLLVEGQAHGSMVQGIGQALFEAAIYDEDGQPQSGSFLSYTMPSAGDLPHLITETIETPNPNVPLGAKGAGESGCIGTPAAIVNAIVDALDGYDSSKIDMPVTPERVWRILQAGPA
jgi:CO/xanthine dehydrogenase Mo-binding subunit